MKSQLDIVAPKGAPRVLIASTAMLAFITFWQAAAIVLNDMGSSAFYAVLCTVYFWWENIKGIPESSEKALKIMYVTTVMVVLLVGWSIFTLSIRGGQIPAWPHLRNLVYSDDALGWLKTTSLPYTI